jgi:hypothetical protein
MIIWILLTLIINISGQFYIDLSIDTSVLKALSIDLLDNYNADTNSLITGNNDLDTNSLNTGNNDLTSEGEGDHNISNNIEEWRERIPPMNEEEEWQPMFRVNDEEEITASDIEEEEEEEEEEEVMFRVNDEEEVTASAMHEELDRADEEWRHDCTTMAREVYETGEFHIYEKVYAKFEASEIADHERLLEFIRNDVVNDNVQLQSELDTQLDEHLTMMETLPDLVEAYIRDLAIGAIDSTRGPVEDLDSLLSPAPVEENTTSSLVESAPIEFAPVEEDTSSPIESAPIDDTTSSLLESAPIENNTPVQESIPVEYTTPGQESIAVEDTALPAPAPAPTEEPAASNEDLPVSKKRNFDEYSDEDPDYELEFSSGKGNKRNKTGS